MCHDIDRLEIVPVIKSPSSTVLASPSFLSLSGPLIPIDLDFRGSLMADNHAHHYNPRTSLAVHNLPMNPG